MAAGCWALLLTEGVTLEMAAAAAEAVLGVLLLLLSFLGLGSMLGPGALVKKTGGDCNRCCCCYRDHQTK